MNLQIVYKTTGLATATLCVPQFIKTREHSVAKNTGKKLIVVQLTGGNDD